MFEDTWGMTAEMEGVSFGSTIETWHKRHKWICSYWGPTGGLSFMTMSSSTCLQSCGSVDQAENAIGCEPPLLPLHFAAEDWWSIGRDCCGAPHYYSWLQGVTSSHKLMPTIEQGPFPQLLCCFHCEFETSMVPSAYPLVVPPAVLNNLQQNRYIYIYKQHFFSDNMW